MMESSCFFSSRGTPNPYATPHSAHYKSRDHIDSHGPASTESIGGAASQRSSPIDSQLYEKLNQIYFGNRHKSVKSVKEIVERANAEFDTLVAKLHKKIDSDNCEYHMMYPFLVRYVKGECKLRALFKYILFLNLFFVDWILMTFIEGKISINCSQIAKLFFFDFSVINPFMMFLFIFTC